MWTEYIEQKPGISRGKAVIKLTEAFQFQVRRTANLKVRVLLLKGASQG